MAKSYQKSACQQAKIRLHQNGKIYFGRNTERKFFFVVTLIMLLLGVLLKLGLL
ncbi:MAG: hypothetical protein JSU83_03165 [Deltaproteobacteria bacterium]|nr:MAG: hypothetical protein JSU83_03165 [Deltaproteobacteria bacterium]